MAESNTSWWGARSRDGGIDEIPLPAVLGAGRLFLCGKHAIAPNPQAALDAVGATHVVCLTERSELSERYPEYVTWLDRRVPDGATWTPIHDMHAPSLAAMVTLVERVRAVVRSDSVIVHCAAGVGRSGTLATALLLSTGVTLTDAIKTVRSSRPMAGPESGPQLDIVRELADHYEAFAR